MYSEPSSKVCQHTSISEVIEPSKNKTLVYNLRENNVYITKYTFGQKAALR